jgi:hypothetical protein
MNIGYLRTVSGLGVGQIFAAQKTGASTIFQASGRRHGRLL